MLLKRGFSVSTFQYGHSGHSPGICRPLQLVFDLYRYLEGVASGGKPRILPALVHACDYPLMTQLCERG